LAVHGQQRPNLEIARGNIESAGDVAPVVQILARFPLVVCVVDDEELTAGLSRDVRQLSSPLCRTTPATP
jgi:hypothetical protein